MVKLLNGKCVQKGHMLLLNHFHSMFPAFLKNKVIHAFTANNCDYCNAFCVYIKQASQISSSSPPIE